MAKVSNVATSRQLLAGAFSALRNALRLFKDAEKMRDSGSAPTAYALAILAIEEASKSYSWVEAASGAAGVTQVEVPAMVSHAQKLGGARAVLLLLEDRLDGSGTLPDDAIVARAREMARDDNLAKQRGFYVDLEDGDVKEPSTIGSEDATAIIEVAEAVVGMATIGALYHGFKHAKETSVDEK